MTSYILEDWPIAIAFSSVAFAPAETPHIPF